MNSFEMAVILAHWAVRIQYQLHSNRKNYSEAPVRLYLIGNRLNVIAACSPFYVFLFNDVLIKFCDVLNIPVNMGFLITSLALNVVVLMK